MSRTGDGTISTAVRILQGRFGRVALLDMDQPLVTHAHSQCHVLLKASGADTRFGVRNRLQPLSDESAVLVNAWEPHFYGHQEGAPRTLILALYIEPAWLAALDRTLATSVHPEFFHRPCVRISPRVRRRAQDLTSDLLLGTPLDAEEAEERIFQLMIAVIERFSELRSLRSDWRLAGCPRDFRIRRATRHLREHVGEPLELDGLARLAGLSRAHFFKLFRENTHLTPAVYASVLRMEAAIEGVAKTDRPLARLALELGFSAPSHFTRFFRTHQGVRPSEYRRVVDVYGGAREQPVGGA